MAFWKSIPSRSVDEPASLRIISTVNTNVRIQIPGLNMDELFSLTAGSIFEKEYGSDYYVSTTTYDGIEARAIIVSSPNAITLMALNTNHRNAGDGSIILPVATDVKETYSYIISSYYPDDDTSPHPSICVVVATKDSTSVEVSCSF